MLNVTTVRQSGHAGWFRMLDLPEESQQHCLICAVCRTEGETHLRNFLRLSLGGNLFVPGKTLRSRTICEHISECDCHTVQKVAVPGLGSTAGWLTSYWEAPYILPPHTPQNVQIPQHEENPPVSCSGGTCSGESLVSFHWRLRNISYIICYPLALCLIESRMWSTS